MGKRLTLVILCLLLLLVYGNEVVGQSVQSGDTLAVLNLQCEGIGQQQCSVVTDTLITELVKLNKYAVTDRTKRDELLGASVPEVNACVGIPCAVEAGKKLGVKKILLGATGQKGQYYYIRLIVVNVETAKLEISATDQCFYEQCDLIPLAVNTLHKMIGMPSGTLPPITPTPPLPAAIKPTEQEQSLIDACKMRGINMPMIRQIIEAHPELATARLIDVQGGKTVYFIHLAVLIGTTDLIDLAIAKGADINAKTSDGDTPLHLARNYVTVEYLISKGADVKAKNSIGDTPLHAACRRGDESSAITLVTSGADINAINNQGQSPFDLAGSNDSLMKALIRNGAHVNLNAGKLLDAAKYLDWSAMRMLIEAGADVSAKDSDGNTVLHLLSMHPFIPSQNVAAMVTDLLIQHGANVNAVNNKGQTPMKVALSNHNNDMVFILQNRGGKVAVGQ